MDESVTVTETYQVLPLRESDFYRWGTAMLRQVATADGNLGGDLLVSERAGGDWHLIHRWADRSHAWAWEESATRARWLTAGASFARPRAAPSYHDRWATPVPSAPEPPPPPGPPQAGPPQAGPAPAAPPKWKMAVVTLMAVFPPVLLFNLTLIPRLRGASVVLRTVVLCIGVTVIVTWVMMPRLMRLFKGWLHPSASARHVGVHRGTSVERARQGAAYRRNPVAVSTTAPPAPPLPEFESLSPDIGQLRALRPRQPARRGYGNTNRAAGRPVARRSGRDRWPVLEVVRDDDPRLVPPAEPLFDRSHPYLREPG